MRNLAVVLMSLLALVGNAYAQSSTDLAFNPITPCRIVDTRNAGGALAANTTRSFDIASISSFALQGGDASDCGGSGAVGNYAAALLNVTVVSTTAGFLTIFPFGAAQPLASALNFGANDIRGNSSIFRLDQGASSNELSVFTTGQTHLIIDIMGYFHTPVPVALECQTTTETIVSMAANSNGDASAPACPAGFTQTGINCETGSYLVPLVFASGGACSARNTTGAAVELRASRRCCRVPGR